MSRLSRGNMLVERYFDGKFGQVSEGTRPIWSFATTTRRHRSSLPIFASHFVWGMSSNCVESVMVDGKLVMEGRKIAHLDVDAIYAEAAKVAKKVWERVDKSHPRGRLS